MMEATLNSRESPLTLEPPLTTNYCCKVGEKVVVVVVPCNLSHTDMYVLILASPPGPPI